MANILKDGKTYTDVRGVVYDDAYMVIDRSQSQAIPVPTFSFDLSIYKDLASRLAGLEPVHTVKIGVPLTNIVSYLATPKASGSTESPLDFVKKHIYIFLGTEQPPVDGIIWSDWKSDEAGGVPQTLIRQ